MKILKWRRCLALVVVALGIGSGCSSDSVVRPSESKEGLEALTPTVQSGVVGNEVDSVPGVRVRDPRGNPVAGVVVNFEATDGGAILNRSVITDAQGVATVGSWKLGTSAGIQTLSARSTGLTAVVFRAEAMSGPVANIGRYNGTDQRTLIGAALAAPLSARVTDSYGNPISGVTVTFTVDSESGVIAGAQTITESQGIATSGVWTLGRTAGEQRVVARAAAAEVSFIAYGCNDMFEGPGGCDVGPPPCASSGECGRLAFVSERSGNADIYVSKADGTGLISLTSHAAADVEPAWSPDGRRIAFVSNRSGSAELYTMNADGSDVTRRSSFEFRSSDIWAISSPTWSPDGARIALAVGGEIHMIDLVSASPNSTRIGFPRGSNSYPAWSPAGQGIAFISDWRMFDFVEDVYVMNPDGSNIRALLTGSAAIHPNSGLSFSQLAWSPGGSRLAVVEYSFAPYGRLTVVAPAVAPSTVLAHVKGYARPTWSPDGQMIAFANQDCGDCRGSIRYVLSDGRGLGGPIISDAHSPSWGPVVVGGNNQ